MANDHVAMGAARALAVSLVLAGCGARDGLLTGGVGGSGVTVEPTPEPGACDELLWPGAAVPMTDYCMDRSLRSTGTAPSAPAHAWSRETVSRAPSSVLADDRGILYALVSTSDSFDDRRSLISLNTDGSTGWVAELPGPPSGGPFLSRERTIVCFVRADGGYRVVHVDPNGRLLSDDPVLALDGTATLLGVGPETTLYFAHYPPGRDAEVVATERDGRLLWVSEPLGGIMLPFALTSRRELVVAAGSPHSLTVLGPDGTTRWKTGLSGYPSRAAVGVDDRIYVVVQGDTTVTSTDSISVFSPQGRELWRRIYDFHLGDRVAVGTDGRLYVRTTAGIAALDAEGNFRWSYDAGENSELAIALDARGQVLLTPVTALLDPDDGAPLWTLSIPASNRGNRFFFPNGGVLARSMVVYSDNGGFFHALR